ncbi:CG31798 [Drosophila busckii]|uniref:CG31798 n=1 Tax=Drosophila busckii TaxID=30019 RepID=A0A0M3QWM0_DROBS|nr:CG31798 [Drosophila busckii]
MSKRQQEILRIEREVRAKLPHRAFREIIFDREQIKASIVPLSYTEARRKHGPIYEALQDELHHAGCRMMPEFLHCLAEKEQALYESISIRARIIDDRPLLYEVVEKLKHAELAVLQRKFKGLKECFTLFYETLVLLEPYRVKYEYALNAVMEHIVSLCHNIEGQERDAAEMIARIYFTYAKYLERTGERANAITYLQTTLELVRGHMWPAEMDSRAGGVILHELVAQMLARQLLIYGRQIVRHQPDEAIEMARRATVLIAEIGREKYLDIFCDTYLERAFFLMEKGDYHPAMLCLELIRPQIIACTEYKFVKLNMKFYLYQGQCAESFDYIEKAISSFKRALRLSRLYDHKEQEAEILLNLGKLFARDTQKTNIAKKCYNQAKSIYIDYNDTHSKKTAVFLMAKLMADEITPLYMAMLKASSSQYCAFYNLRQWKNRCRPFWHSLGDEIMKQERNKIYCLLEEENPDPVKVTDEYLALDGNTFKVEEGDLSN